MAEKWIKLHTDFLNSSIMAEDQRVSWLFIVCLLLAREQDWEGGTFKAHTFALAQRANMTETEVREGMKILTSPDSESTSKSEDGRRLVNTGQNQYIIVNWDKYQDNPLRSKWRNDKRRQRGGQVVDTSGHEVDSGGQVVDSPSVSVSISSSTPNAMNKGGVGGESKKAAKGKKKTEYTDGFNAFWEQTWKRGTKKNAFDAWQKIIRIEDCDMNQIVIAAGEWRKIYELRDADKRPHVSTWLNSGGYEADIAAETAKGKKGAGGFDPNVGAPPTIDEEKDKKRRQMLRGAILAHALHLSKLEITDKEAALIVMQATDDLEAIIDAKLGEMEMCRRFQKVTDDMLSSLGSFLTAEDKKSIQMYSEKHNVAGEPAQRAAEALLRKRVREMFGIADITTYDWEG